jgi:hypothetical protein
MTKLTLRSTTMFFEKLESRRLFSGNAIPSDPSPPPLPPLPISDAHLPPPTKKSYAGDDGDREDPQERPHGPFELPRNKIVNVRIPGR